MKPTEYKGDDAQELGCVKEYKVQDGTKDPETFKVGKTYMVSPASAAHLLRQEYVISEQLRDRRGTYMNEVGRGVFFVDVGLIKAEGSALEAAIKVASDRVDPAKKAAVDADKEASKAEAAAAKLKDDDDKKPEAVKVAEALRATATEATSAAEGALVAVEKAEEALEEFADRYKV